MDGQQTLQWQSLYIWSRRPCELDLEITSIHFFFIFTHKYVPMLEFNRYTQNSWNNSKYKKQLKYVICDSVTQIFWTVFDRCVSQNMCKVGRRKNCCYILGYRTLLQSFYYVNTLLFVMREKARAGRNPPFLKSFVPFVPEKERSFLGNDAQPWKQLEMLICQYSLLPLKRIVQKCP